MRNHLRIAALLVALCALLGATSRADAAEPAAKPGWRLSIIPYPTNFAPGGKATSTTKGPGYLLVAANVGAAPTEGEFKLTDTLPAGLVPSPSQAPYGIYGPGFEGSNGKHLELDCEASGQTVSCGTSEPLYPGQVAQAVIPVEVEAGAPAGVLDRAVVEGGGAPGPATATMPTTISAAPAPLGFLAAGSGAHGSVTNADGSTATLAGSHPYQLTVGMNFSDNVDATRATFVPGGGVREVSGEVPQGVVVNPAATPKCSEVELEDEATLCPDATQIGTVMLSLSAIDEKPFLPLVPLYNMVPPPGVPAEFAFEVSGGVYIHLIGRVRSGSDYGLSADVHNIPAQIGVIGDEVTFWGDPSDPSHDHVRGLCVGHGGACPTERLDTAGVSLPSSCSAGPIQTLLKVTNWIGEEVQASYGSTDADGNPVGVDGCNQLRFEPTIEVRPTTTLADSPTGLDFDLHQPQDEGPTGRSTASLKDTTVVLPEGMALNPAAAAGLGSCTEGELGADGTKPADCPGDSKVAAAAVKTPLLEAPLPGAVYLAKPYENRFGSLLALYLVIEDPIQGIVAKVPGKVELNPASGRLTASFEESPELPLEDIRLHFYPGARATLTTPASCGAYTVTSTLTPWSSPQGADAHPTDTFQTTTAPNGGNCPRSAGEAPNGPAFSAGTISPAAGAYSPFVLHLSRADDTQRLATIDTTLPAGLTGKLAGIPYCPEAGIAKARSREAPDQGAAESSDPSCPAASEIGTIDTAAGSGPTPLHVQGRLYLAGPYKGAPLSMAAIVPAVAGPFDLGDVVVRIALHVDPLTARIQATSDPLPQIIEGVPLDVRSIAIDIGRPGFTLNPTSCEPKSVAGLVTSALGRSVPLAERFQVGGCRALPFYPKLALRVFGKTNRNAKPRFRAVVTTRPGEANIAAAQVNLPHSEFLEQAHIKTICTRVQWSEGAGHGAACPQGSIYGYAKAWTPLLDQPLAGPVYLRASNHKLPDLVAALNGQVDVELVGKVDSGPNKGIRNTFEVVPDAPVSKFVLTMRGGKKGLLVNSEDLCAKRAKTRAIVRFVGQNGTVRRSKPKVADGCKKKHRKAKRSRHRGASRSGHRQSAR